MIAEKVRTALGQETKRDPATIELKHSLRDDLGLTSLDAIELLFKLEQEFDLEIPDADLQKFKTVEDLVSYLDDRLTGGAAREAAAPVSAPAPTPARATVARPRAPAPRKRTARRASS